MSDNSEKKGTNDCNEFAKCLQYLHLMLDNEATEEQEIYLKNHIHKCMVCFEQYEVEKQIRELLRSKLTNQKVPADLAQAIRNKVFQSA
ncbi:MAG: anti-sigma factor [Marinoscillum sp.]|uniref:anti-sigma factor n=1 Tax=Marinoscillum sp. TaxID=2024838 RepID=UPI0032FB9820